MTYSPTEDEVDQLRGVIARITSERDAAVAECARLSEALRYYTHAGCYRCNRCDDGEFEDDGAVARAALAGGGHEWCSGEDMAFWQPEISPVEGVSSMGL